MDFLDEINVGTFMYVCTFIFAVIPLIVGEGIIITLKGPPADKLFFIIWAMVWLVIRYTLTTDYKQTI